MTIAGLGEAFSLEVQEHGLFWKEGFADALSIGFPTVFCMPKNLEESSS